MDRAVRALLCLLLAWPLRAGEWQLSGSNTARFEVYDVEGDRAQSPYPFEGPQGFDQFDLNFSRRNSAFDGWRGQIFGVVNGSDYRATERGLVPERIALVRENGDAPTPYRLELGDFFGYYSFRTMQRSLRGVQIEWQPRAAEGRARRSLVFTGASGTQPWREYDPGDDLNLGLSWLLATPSGSNYSLSFLHNSREGDPGAGTLDRSQRVLGAAAERTFRSGARTTVLEGEWNFFQGDHDGTAGAASGQSRDDQGVFLQASGTSRDNPFTWRLRYEDYGRDYRPVGASVPADRRSAEAHAGWTFDSGLQLRTRYQSFEDDQEGANPLETDTYGFTLSGPMLTGIFRGMSGTLNAFEQKVENATRSTDQVTRNATLNLTKPLGSRWTGTLGWFFQQNDVEVVAAPSRAATRQWQVGANRSLDLWGWSGTLSTSLLIRDVDGASGSNDLQRTAALLLGRGSRTLGLNVSHLTQDRGESGQGEVDTTSIRANHQWTFGPNALTLEYSLDMREPSPGGGTDSHLVAVYWTRAFDTVVGRRRRTPAAGSPAPSAPVLPDTLRRRGPALLASLLPGLDLQGTRSHLRAAGVVGESRIGALRVYSHRLLEEIDHRQRLVLETRGDALVRSALVVDLDDAGDRSSAAQVYERVRKAFLDLLGPAVTNLERGSFETDLGTELSGGPFLRVSEWALEGGVLRLGIPRRLDGRIRIEAQVAEAFPTPATGLWSFDAVP